MVVLDGEQQGKDVACATLGLAVLSSFCRVPQLAAEDVTISLVPLFVKVSRALGHLLNYTGTAIPLGRSAMPIRPSAWCCC